MSNLFHRNEDDIRRDMSHLYSMGVSAREYADFIAAANERLKTQPNPKENK